MMMFGIEKVKTEFSSQKLGNDGKSFGQSWPELTFTSLSSVFTLHCTECQAGDHPNFRNKANAAANADTSDTLVSREGVFRAPVFLRRVWLLDINRIAALLAHSEDISPERPT